MLGQTLFMVCGYMTALHHHSGTSSQHYIITAGGISQGDIGPIDETTVVNLGSLPLASPCVQSISVAFEHCVLRDRVRQELPAGGASRKRHGLEYAKVWKPCRHFA